jgi:hypothetical protein
MDRVPEHEPETARGLLPDSHPQNACVLGDLLVVDLVWVGVEVITGCQPQGSNVLVSALKASERVGEGLRCHDRSKLSDGPDGTLASPVAVSALFGRGATQFWDIACL